MLKKRYKIIAALVCVVLFVYFVNATLEKQLLQTNQEQAIYHLTAFSCRYHDYKIRDAGGKYFGYHTLEQFEILDIFRYPAMVAAPKDVIPSRSYSCVFLFPIRAKRDLQFQSVLEDLKNPHHLIDELAQYHTSGPVRRMDPSEVSVYFSKHLDRRYRLEIWFVDDDALNYNLTTRKATVVDKMVVSVPVNSSIVDTLWR